MRQTFLPSLKKIKIENFTLYPNGLDFEYNFINGFNLILGGNGMGKTTFVNIIKYGIIGNYRKSFDYTRTYKDRIIEKRVLYPSDYFKNRMDNQITLNEAAKVTVEFYLNDNLFVVERNLEEPVLNSVIINSTKLRGRIINQFKYESLGEDEKKEHLQFNYEKEIENLSGLNFDDLIFFVNEVLYFGEDHKTILWNNGFNGYDVQNELFNKYFNSPDLDKERQEAMRLSKYFDSLSRHRSEDIRAIRKVLDKVNSSKEDKNNQSDPNIKILNKKNDIEKIDLEIEKIHEATKLTESEISVLQNNINKLSVSANELEEKKNSIEHKLNGKIWQTLHPNFDVFVRNIKSNKMCPICNQPSPLLTDKVLHNPTHCFACGNEIQKIEDKDLQNEYNNIVIEDGKVHQLIQNTQKTINQKDNLIKQYDVSSKNLYQKKRQLQSELRNLEFSKSNENEPDKHQAFLDEIERLEIEKNEHQEKSKIESSKAEEISNKIEEHIIQNTNKFSAFFSGFAESFLGVKCSLTFDSLDGSNAKRFYPIIDGKIRRFEEELSESQRFFIDHSFRMSILTFFYTKPTFYIVETPDSSLDISYEKNAADVFLKFLMTPNSLIITSNLNNSSFINHIIQNEQDVKISMIGLLDIAKQSLIQNTSENLRMIYNDIKNQINNK